MIGRNLAVLAVIVVVAGCSELGTNGAGQQGNGNGNPPAAGPTEVIPLDTSQPATGSGLDLTPAPRVSYSGKTDKKTHTFAIGSPLKVEYSYKGSGNFIVDLNGTDGSTIGSIANRIGSGSLATWVYGGSGNGYFDVIADGSWTITATAVIPTTAKIPATFKGNTDAVTVPFEIGDQATVKWTYKGSGNFIVDVIDPADGSPVDNAANLIGNSTDSTQLYNDGGLVAFDVTADGTWTLTVTSP
jgi:hypothetical protein